MRAILPWGVFTCTEVIWRGSFCGPPCLFLAVRGLQHSGLAVEVVGTRNTASSGPDPPQICWLWAGWEGLSNPSKRNGPDESLN